MKVVRTNHFQKGPPPEFSVQDAVEMSCDGSDYGRGSLEQAQETANNAAKKLGILAQALFDRDLLSKDELNNLLDYRFKVEE